MAIASFFTETVPSFFTDTVPSLFTSVLPSAVFKPLNTVLNVVTLGAFDGLKKQLNIPTQSAFDEINSIVKQVEDAGFESLVPDAFRTAQNAEPFLGSAGISKFLPFSGSDESFVTKNIGLSINDTIKSTTGIDLGLGS